MRTGVLVVAGFCVALLIVVWITPKEPRVVRHRPPAPTAEDEGGGTLVPTPQEIVAPGKRGGAGGLRLPTRRSAVPLEREAAATPDPPPGQTSADPLREERRTEAASGRAQETSEDGTAGSGMTAPGEGTQSDAADHMLALAPPVLVSRGTLEYPPEGYTLVLDREAPTARLRVDAAQGLVVLRVLVRADGSVAKIEVTESSGIPTLDAAALRAAPAWKFTPATSNGTPIDAWVIVPVRFVVP